MVKKARSPTRARFTTFNQRNPKSPAGYGIYKVVHRIRWGKTVMLTPKGYAYDPWRAMETAMGIKPRATIRSIRARKIGLGR